MPGFDQILGSGDGCVEIAASKLKNAAEQLTAELQNVGAVAGWRCGCA